jgi:putative oxidoreductase
LRLITCDNKYRETEDVMRTVRLSDVGLLLIRVMVGVVFVFHGSQKLFGAFGGPGLEGFAGFLAKMGLPQPYLQAVLAGSAEFLGGLSLGLGLGTRVAVVPLVVTMAVASVMAHGHAFDAQKGGMEYPLMLLVVLVGLGLTGPGAVALGRFLRRYPTPVGERIVR